MTETNVARTKLYQNFLKIPHRQYNQIVPELRVAMQADPDFIARASVDFATGGTDIRDLADCAAITLLTAPSEYPMYREAGVCVLLGRQVYGSKIEPADMRVPGIPVFSPRIFRILDYISRDAGHKAPRLMTGVVSDFLYWLESDPYKFDTIVMRNRKSMKNLYTHYHIKMDSRAKAILYQNMPPFDSRLFVLRQITTSKDPAEQARLIVENKISYVIAASLVEKLSPVIGVALIAVMSPQEALNSRAWVEKSGLLAFPDVRSAYEAKVADASVSAATVDHRRSAQGTDEGVAKAAAKAAEKAVSKQNHIKDDVELFMDHSGSMEHSIAIATELASRIAPLCTGDFHWIAFTDLARELQMRERTLAGAKQAVVGIKAGGGTHLGNAWNFAMRAGHMPAKIAVVSDGATYPGFARGVKQYIENTGINAKVVFLRVPGQQDSLTREMEAEGIQFDRFETDGSDYYVFDQVAQALGGPIGQSLVERILSINLPYRAGK